MNLWKKLEYRLRSVSNANYRDNPHESQCCLLSVKLLKSNGRLIGWLHPEVIPIEPKIVDIEPSITGWQQVIDKLCEGTQESVIIRNGQPIAWLDIT